MNRFAAAGVRRFHDTCAAMFAPPGRLGAREPMAVNDTILLWITLGIFNIAIIVLLRLTLKSVSLTEAMREKSTPEQPNASDTSYSRIAGMLGAIVLGCLIWGLGNAVLARAILEPQEVETMLKGVWPFLLSTSALFAPYAFNQLKDAMQPPKKPN